MSAEEALSKLNIRLQLNFMPIALFEIFSFGTIVVLMLKP